MIQRGVLIGFGGNGFSPNAVRELVGEGVDSGEIGDGLDPNSDVDSGDTWGQNLDGNRVNSNVSRVKNLVVDASEAPQPTGKKKGINTRKQKYVKCLYTCIF